MTDEVRACVACRHFKGLEAEPYLAQYQRTPQPECQHPKAATRDLIYGKALCHQERASKKGCGQQGKLWEARPNKKD